MIRTLALAGLVTLFTAGTSQAQYRDSSPANDDDAPQYDTESSYADDDYDRDIYGSHDGYRHDDDEFDDDDSGYRRPNVDVGVFVNLADDGRWFFTAGFGWVWRPYAAAGWRPYTAGRWVWTVDGWTWLSYEPFGWATYHYGYWTCDNRLGWVWIPGYEWSACRVQWAYYDNYVCWAPLAPPGHRFPRPFTTAGFNVWFTIGARHFCDPYPTRYCVRPDYHPGYSERVAYKSPARGYVQQYTHTPIRTSTVQFKYRSTTRGYSGQPRVYSNQPRAYVKSRPNVQPRPYKEAVLVHSGRTIRPYIEMHRNDVTGTDRTASRKVYKRDQTHRVESYSPAPRQVAQADGRSRSKSDRHATMKSRGGDDNRRNSKR